MSKPHTQPGTLELQVLKAIWHRQPCAVQDIADLPGERGGHARTTVLTIMQRLNATVFVVFLVPSICVADVFHMPSGQTSLESTPVGNAGNAADTRLMNDGTSGYGAVPYRYDIGKYEVTQSQYCEFLNSKAKSDPYSLYSASMGTNVIGGIMRSGSSPNYFYSVKTGFDNKPVNYVSWFDAVRFANWLTNGQGKGDTESGAYTISGGGPDNGSITTPTAAQRATWASGITRYWLLPTENEWYKAAFHKNDGVTGHYWTYATTTDAAPFSDNPASLDFPANSANYYNNDGIANGFNDGYAVESTNYLTDVGAYAQSSSSYGTFDQDGNVWEFNETLIGSSKRGVRGGSALMAFSQPADGDLAAWFRLSISPSSIVGGENVGFRVASVPEPACSSLFCFAACILLKHRAQPTIEGLEP